MANVSYNKEGQGAVGRHGYLFYKLGGFRIVKFDLEKEEVIKSKNGFCIECAAGEPGELLLPIKDNSPLQFEGYVDKVATKKKILRNVFQKGDAYFRTGDLLKRTKDGYYYFVDRIGDSFRWKGENISTTEVSEIISGFGGIQEATVYGVPVPKKDGRACMAAIVLNHTNDHDRSGKPKYIDLDLSAFLKYCQSHLPPYAIPLFLRFVDHIEVTATFKHQKLALKQQGIDLKVINDPVFWLNPKTNAYEPFNQNEYGTLVSSTSARL